MVGFGARCLPNQKDMPDYPPAATSSIQAIRSTRGSTTNFSTPPNHSFFSCCTKFEEKNVEWSLYSDLGDPDIINIRVILQEMIIFVVRLGEQRVTKFKF